MLYFIFHILITGSSFLVLNLQFGGFLKKILEDFSRKNVKIIKYRLHLDVWKLQIGKMIRETECVRFAKIGGFFNNFGRFFPKLI